MPAYGGSLARRHITRRQQQALADAARKARRGRQSITAAIAENGERMSDEGRALLEGLAKAMKGIEGVVGGRR